MANNNSNPSSQRSLGSTPDANLTTFHHYAPQSDTALTTHNLAQHNHNPLSSGTGASSSITPEPTPYAAKEDRVNAFLARQQLLHLQTITQTINRMELARSAHAQQTAAAQPPTPAVQAYDTTMPSFRPATDNFAGQGQRLSVSRGVSQQQRQQQQVALFGSAANPHPPVPFARGISRPPGPFQQQGNPRTGHSNQCAMREREKELAVAERKSRERSWNAMEAESERREMERRWDENGDVEMSG